MNKHQIYNFAVPVSGQEFFSVIASSYEEALGKIRLAEYHEKSKLQDVDWDFGLGQSSEEHLPKCYTLSEVNKEVL